MQRILAQLASNSALLEPAERHVRMQLVHAVDPRGARLQLVRRRQRAVDVLREDGGGEAVDGVVGLADDVWETASVSVGIGEAQEGRREGKGVRVSGLWSLRRPQPGTTLAHPRPSPGAGTTRIPHHLQSAKKNTHRPHP